MKQFSKLFLIAFLFMIGKIPAQQKWNLGVKAGINLPEIADFYDENFKKKTYVTFVGGVFGTYTILPKLVIQTEVLYSMQGMKADGLIQTNIGGTDVDIPFNATFDVRYITVPLVARYKVWKELYAEAGPQLGFLIHKRGKGFIEGIPDEIDEDFDVFFQAFGFDIQSKKLDVGLNFGLGYSFYKNFSLGGRYYFGLSPLVEGSDVDFDSRNIVFSFFLEYKIPLKK